MKLGVNVSVDGAGDLAAAAERLGYQVAFVPEGYRTDAISVLGVLAGRTERMDIASGVLQIPARSPVMTAMTAVTLDTLSHGRFRLGLGVSNAHISEGWHGVPFGQPLARAREYVRIVRTALRGEPVEHDGEHFRLPLPGGRGGAFQQFGDTARAGLPIYLAGVGPRSLELAGEVADGWFGVFCSPERVAAAVRHLRTGRERAGADMADFDVVPSVPLVVGPDPEIAANPVRHYVARFVSIGPRQGNFYHALLAKSGFPEAADEIHARQQAGDAAGAAAAVPFEFLDSTALLGPADRIAKKMLDYRDAGVRTLALSPFGGRIAERVDALGAAADALRQVDG